VIRRAFIALAVLVLLAGCGGAAGEGEGTAQLWVTRDRGAKLLLDTKVQAGQTLMRALASEADVKTRYGGRYVQAVNGIEGSLSAQRDWFWFVNGYEGDRSAASYRLHDGDVAWLDYRGWQREGEARVVVGAFPEPFVHGYGGKTRPVAIRYEAGSEKRARTLGAELGADEVAPVGAPVPEGANVLEVRGGASSLTGELLGETAGDPVRFVWRGDPAPQRRYAVP
jgi:Domain of unknown function (DUF4430)